MTEGVGANLEKIREAIRRACETAGRDPAGVRLVAVTKAATVDAVRTLLATGHRDLGENRVQEALRKQEAFAEIPDIAWHLIGPLQRNKVSKVINRFTLLHAVDRVDVAEALALAAAERKTRVAALLEVNVSGETSKHGFAEGDLAAAFAALTDLPALEVRGFMTMAPIVTDPEAARPVFRRLRQLRDRWQETLGNAFRLTELSMGMSQDYRVAAEEGSTLVRVGAAIFQ
ncbi:MAG: YggS family pyridoxal phosphate-dependent enzyme [Planctomycetota bacterium]